MEITRRSYPVQVFTATHRIEGIFEPVGNFMNAINNPESTCFPMSNATFTPLASGKALRSISVPEVVVNKADIVYVCFQDDTVQKEMNIFKRVARMVVYTPGFAVRGDFHLGVEDQTRDMLDTLRGQFQPLTDVTVFPLIEAQVSIDRQHDLILLNTQKVQLYHPDITQ
jgi:hypothetical protein